MRATALLTAVAMAILGAACDGASRTSEQSDHIMAAEGGEIALEDDVSLQVEPDALAMDTTVSVSIGLPDDVSEEPAGAAEVLEIEPRDTVLEIPAELRWKPADRTLDGADAPEIRQFVDGVWITAGSTIVDETGHARTSISAFGVYALVLSTPADAGGGDAGSSPCSDSCMSQPGAVCCTACGCMAEVRCDPVCAESETWDCELETCRAL